MILGAGQFISALGEGVGALPIPAEVQNLVSTALSPPLGVGSWHAWGWLNSLYPFLGQGEPVSSKSGRLPSISRAWSISKPSSLC